MVNLNADIMRAISPRYITNRVKGARQKEIIDSVGAVLQGTLAEFQIDTPIRAAHFLAQCCHESAGFSTTEEQASGSAYEGRANLGNTQPGDGPRFKGRGIIQLTGRANYAEYGNALGLDLIGNPEMAADPVTSLRIACEFWKRHKLNDLADRDDVTTITRRINGGLNGIDDRKAILVKAKAAMDGVTR